MNGFYVLYIYSGVLKSGFAGGDHRLSHESFFYSTGTESYKLNFNF